MKILSFQPYSLYAAGGGSRILRRLYEGREENVRSLVVSAYPSQYKGGIAEIMVYAKPVHRPWMRSFIRAWSIWLRSHLFVKATQKRLFHTALREDFDVLHIVNHGALSTVLCNKVLINHKLLWVSFHDHFASIGSSFEQASTLWHNANRRLVISQELGDEYNRLFGEQKYEIVTDGVGSDEITVADELDKDSKKVVIYFAGLLHLDYIPLFRVLADALDILSESGEQVNLLLRGTQKLDFLTNRKFAIEYKPLTIDNAELKKELDLATILYLPMKFTVPEFYRYSLSTKMVGYLGAPGAILYHGPADSAACNLLIKNNAAQVCETLDVQDLAEKIRLAIQYRKICSDNAKKLARQNFNIKTIRDCFWQVDSIL